jgi:hypothetical protein
MEGPEGPAPGQRDEIPAMSISAVSRTEPGSGGPVKAVSVISTGTVQIRPEHPYGSRKPMYC